MRQTWVSRVGMIALVGFLVLAGNPYTAQAVKPVPPPAPAVPKVVDANNNVVGQVIGTNNEAGGFSGKPLYAVVALNISVPTIVVQVPSNGFLGTASLFFTDSTCVGQPYFLSEEIDFELRLFPVVGVGINGTTLYTPRASSAPVFSPSSYLLTFLGVCQSRGNDNLVIADPLIDLSTQFTPPYRFVYP